MNQTSGEAFVSDDLIAWLNLTSWNRRGKCERVGVSIVERNKFGCLKETNLREGDGDDERNEKCMYHWENTGCKIEILSLTTNPHAPCEHVDAEWKILYREQIHDRAGPFVHRDEKAWCLLGCFHGLWNQIEQLVRFNEHDWVAPIQPLSASHRRFRVLFRLGTLVF